MSNLFAQTTSPLTALERDEPPAMGRGVLYALLALVVLLVAWAVFGRLDIVAVAQGKLVPSTYVKIVQPADSGIVKDILVAEGQAVKTGQVLIRMDNAFGEADWQSLQADYHLKDLTIRRIDAELAGLPLRRQEGDPETVYLQAAAQYAADRQALESAIAEEQSVMGKARHDLATTEQVKTKLVQTLPHYQSQEKAYQDLAAQGFMGRLMADEKTRDRIEREQDLRAQESAILSAQSGIDQSDKRIRQLRADYRMRLQAERVEAYGQFEKLRQELAKQERRNTLVELKAPQDGVIKDLATHTTGTVVSPGTILMTLVPSTEKLRAEVWIRNEDVGFVRPGQPTKVKLMTFQFQKYGMLDGCVAQVGADAADNSDNKSGKTDGQLLYRTLVDLDSTFLEMDGQRYALAAGMQVSAEVKLGDRSVLEYLLSPIQKAFHEAGRER
ncbi:MAG: HlyD family type I secretion periplasmic adaptor subunit [Gallionellaceae bacterium]|nr:HlyD family type I secretion periplasmic adaptor subunit [Gallionellaceae bacterium]